MANNLPSNIGRHTMYQDGTYQHTLIFPDGYTMPAVVTAQVRKSGSNVVTPGVAPTVQKTGQRIIFTYSPTTLKKIAGLSDQYFILDGVTLLGGEINVRIGYGESTSSSSNVTITQGVATVVQIEGFAQVQQLTALAITASAQSGISANNSENSADRSELAAENVSNDAMAVELSREQVVQIKADILEAQMEIDSSKRINVATFAEMLSLRQLNKPRNFRVRFDETQNDTPYVRYSWDGEILFMYDIYALDPQPTF